MYGKIFASMFKGSLYGQWEAIVTFTCMIVLADQEGEVDFSPEALSAHTSIPLDIIQKGIASLEAPDPQTRTPDEDGRRIVRVSDERTWGWRITNYAHYRAMRNAEERREYFKQHKRKQRAASGKQSPPVSTTVHRRLQNVHDVTEAEAVSRKQEAVSKKQETKEPHTQRERLLLERFRREPERWAVVEFLESQTAADREGWVSTISGCLEGMGMRGGQPATAPAIAVTCQDFLTKSQPEQRNKNFFRICVAKTMDTIASPTKPVPTMGKASVADWKPPEMRDD